MSQYDFSRPPRYYMLYTFDTTTQKWSPQFGDYTRRIVQEELRASYPKDRYPLVCIAQVDGDSEAAIQQRAATLAPPVKAWRE